jgi:TolB-like protein
MAGIIPGYEYEIFISYRQKDNMYDGWVTDFVSNLKREIEATFREEIRVYFDMNPRDGLLENYDVDDSLKQKLKCLVLIPIISRTYCDPKAFAWKHEFKAFIDLASKDQFGLKVKLASGNVASRVLPVRIYELSNSEVELCEAVAGGVLRGINFIYKSAGVNRPLRANEDHPGDNINKTYYRDQINKVANSIKEILDAFSDTQNKPVQNNETRILRPVKSKNIMRLTGSILLAVFIITGIILGSEILKSGVEIEKSIAVLPFINDSHDEQNLHIVNGLMDEILISLQSIKGLRVISRNSVEQYRQSSRLSTPAIAKELGVSYIVEGSVQKYDSSLRLRVELIRAIGKEANLWAKSFVQEQLEGQELSR